MQRKIILLAIAGLWFLPLAAHAETIVAHETEKYFYKDGEMKKFEGQYENTYYLDMDKWTLTRTRVYDYQIRKIKPDDTVYEVDTTLRSHPVHAVHYSLPPVIRGVGRPNDDSVETVAIDDDFVTTSTSTAGTLVISRAKRLK
ncbi:MAG: hypothetical protein COT00_05220 [Candidatus Omnitrophica bacterium CG07_land_8_20_14_0_80_50_8]|nr:MAG: hypothetical protein COT00_05220 [Candidatus Omnitrophica bacterium CG07_land_8_20_14_0_80_50_8]